MSNLPVKGGCLCGAVRYELSEVPDKMGLCYCRSCQRETGSSYFPFMLVTADKLKVEGDVSWFTVNGASGNAVHRGFCPTCGSTVIGRPEVVPGCMTVSASSLDDTSIFKPGMALWTEDVQKWDTISKDLMQFEKNPT